jgi:hypothetical protein
LKIYKEPTPLREIHEIQEIIYEEMKNMNDKEKPARIRAEAEKAKTKYSLNIQKAPRS